MQIKGEHMPEREEHKKDGLQISNDGWGNGLGARTAKNAVKTIFFNFREYVSFFVVLFIIQSMFWLLCFTTTTNLLHEHEEITELYDYQFEPFQADLYRQLTNDNHIIQLFLRVHVINLL